MKEKIIKNKEFGLKGIISKTYPLNLNESETTHTNSDGSVVEIKVIGEEYFSKRKKGNYAKSRGSSWLFPNHLEYNGWLSMNSFVEVDVEELEDKWS